MVSNGNDATIDQSNGAENIDNSPEFKENHKRDLLNVLLDRGLKGFVDTNMKSSSGNDRYLNKQFLLDDFLSYLHNNGLGDTLTDLEEVLGRRLAWNDIKDWVLEGKWTVNQFVKYQLKNTLDDKLESSICRAFIDKLYKKVVTESIFGDVFKEIFKSRIYDGKTYHIGKTIQFWKKRKITFESLNQVISEITKDRFFPDEKLSEWNEFFGSFVISNSEILEKLKEDTYITNEDFSDINNSSKPLKDMGENVKTVMNMITSMEALNWIEKDLEQIKNYIDTVDRVFKVPDFDGFLKGFNITSSLIANKIDSDETLKSRFADASENQYELNELSLEVYIQILKEKNRLLGDIFEKLNSNRNSEGKIDFSMLNEREKQIILDYICENHISEGFKNTLSSYLNIDPTSISSFIKNELFNLSHKTLSLSVGGQSFDLTFSKKDIIGIMPTDGQRVIDDLNDLGLFLDFSLVTEDGDIDYKGLLKELYPGKFDKISDTEFTTNCKVKFTKDNNSVIEGYALRDNQNSKTGYRIYDRPFMEYGAEEKGFISNDELLEYTFEVIEPASSINLGIDDIKDLIGLYISFKAFEKLPEQHQNLYKQEAFRADLNNAFSKLDPPDGESSIEETSDGESEKTGTEECDDLPGESDGEGNDGESGEEQKGEESRSIENDYKDFIEEINSLGGDNINFKSIQDLEKETNNGVDGLQLFIRYAASETGGSEWFKARIILSKKGGVYTFKLKLFPVTFGIGEMNGKEVPDNGGWDVNFENIYKIKSTFSGNIYKFKPVYDLKGLVTIINGISTWSKDGGKFSTGAKLWQNVRYNEESKKIIQDGVEGGEITHLGKTVKDGVKENGEFKVKEKFLGYELFWNSDSVRVVNNNIGFDMTMDLTSFIIFATEKGLIPMSKDEYKKKSTEQEEGSIGRQEPLRMLSIGAALQTFKMVKDNFMHKFKTRDDLMSAKLYNNMISSSAFGAVGAVANVVSLGSMKESFQDLKIEAFSDLDSRIWSTISSYKDRLQREGGAHAKSTVKIIDSHIFETNNTHRQNPLKVAGYLLYAIETGGSPYFRGLAKYAGKGLWVEKLLGPSHKRKYMSQVASIKEELSRNPRSDGLLDKLVKAEMWYIKDVAGGDAFRSQFGSNFSTVLEKTYMNSIDNSKVGDCKSNEQNKNSFADILSGYENYVVGLRGPNALGALQALLGRAEDKELFKDFVGAMIAPLITRAHRHMWGKGNRESYKKMSRSIGLPFGLFLTDNEGPKKMAMILDYACMQAGMSEDKWFSNYTGWTEDATSDENFGKSFKQILKKFFYWWSTYKNEVTDFLYNRDLNYVESYKKCGERLEDLKTNKKISEKRKNDIQKAVERYYNNTLFDGDTGSHTGNTEFNLSNAGVYEEVVFNYGAGAFDRLMSPGDVSGHDDTSRKMWKGFGNRFKSLTKMRIGKQEFIFVMRKIDLWFKPQYSGVYENFVAMIYDSIENRKNSKDNLRSVFTNYFEGQNLPSNSIDQAMEDAFRYIELFIHENLDFFKENGKLSYKTFKEVFGKDMADKLILIESDKQKEREEFINNSHDAFPNDVDITAKKYRNKPQFLGENTDNDTSSEGNSIDFGETNEDNNKI